MKRITCLLFALIVFGCDQGEVKTVVQKEKVVINEAVRTILYLPLYHAKEKKFFEEQGIDVEIETAGTATASFAAMLNGSADFSLADPMYVPISRESGAKTKLVAQVVGRIAVWGVSKNPDLDALNSSNIKGLTISTHPQPMTAYTYTVKAITDAGLKPDVDVIIKQIRPPNEISAMLQDQADVAFTLEPNTSIAVSMGAKVVKSYPSELGDQIFTGLMTSESYIENHPDTTMRVVGAIQKALDDLHKNPDAGIETAAIYFEGLNREVISTAVARMVNEQVIPKSVIPTVESWSKAIQVRLDVGDLKKPVELSEAYYSAEQ